MILFWTKTICRINLLKIKMIENQFPIKNDSQHKYLKNLPSDSWVFSEVAAYTERPEGPREHFGAKKHILRFWAKRYTFCENELNLAKFWLWAAPCRKAYKRNGIFVILEPQNGEIQLLGTKVHFWVTFCILSYFCALGSKWPKKHQETITPTSFWAIGPKNAFERQNA